MKRDEISNEIIIQVLHKNKGLLSPTAKKLKVSRRSLYNWIKDDKELKEEVKQCRESQIDFSESKLYENINLGKEASIMFHLKTIGKDRGYVERQEFTEFKEQPLFKVDPIVEEKGHFDEDKDDD